MDLKSATKYFLIGLGMFVIAIGIFLYTKYYKGLQPAFAPPPEDVANILPKFREGTSSSTSPFTLEPGFVMEVYATGIDGARDIVIAADNSLWVSSYEANALYHIREVAGTVQVDTIAAFRDKPHGLAFHPVDKNILYVAEETKISRFDITKEAVEPEVIYTLPKGGRHVTRSLLFGANDELYVSIGSSCDVCNEQDERLATVMVMRDDGSYARVYASGLRNAPFLAMHPQTGKIWVTEMGRDNLGDDLPPDEINILTDGAHYGWPYCYGSAEHDADFDPDGRSEVFCGTTQMPEIEIPAHSAPLGLAFMPVGGVAGGKYANDLFVAYHGSWNRSEPTGYKVVRFKNLGDSYGPAVDFITGWLTDEGALGRPVDIVINTVGDMFISDDKAQVIYRIYYAGEDSRDLLPPPREQVPVTHDTAACRVTGCSGEICSDKEEFSSCVYREEFACYRDAVCERQADGNCGFTRTDVLEACIKNAI